MWMQLYKATVLYLRNFIERCSIIKATWPNRANGIFRHFLTLARGNLFQCKNRTSPYTRLFYMNAERELKLQRSTKRKYELKKKKTWWCLAIEKNPRRISLVNLHSPLKLAALISEQAYCSQLFQLILVVQWSYAWMS